MVGRPPTTSISDERLLPDVVGSYPSRMIDATRSPPGHVLRKAPCLVEEPVRVVATLKIAPLPSQRDGRQLPTASCLEVNVVERTAKQVTRLTVYTVVLDVVRTARLPNGPRPTETTAAKRSTTLIPFRKPRWFESLGLGGRTLVASPVNAGQVTRALVALTLGILGEQLPLLREAFLTGRPPLLIASAARTIHKLSATPLAYTVVAAT